MEARTSIDIDGLLDAPYEVQDLDNEEHTQCESMWQTMTRRPARNGKEERRNKLCVVSPARQILRGKLYAIGVYG
jgi:hypothetical protein